MWWKYRRVKGMLYYKLTKPASQDLQAMNHVHPCKSCHHCNSLTKTWLLEKLSAQSSKKKKRNECMNFIIITIIIKCVCILTSGGKIDKTARFRQSIFTYQKGISLLDWALVISYLDYWNLTDVPNFFHTTLLLHNLHWLPRVAHIRFKTLLLGYHAVNASHHTP